MTLRFKADMRELERMRDKLKGAPNVLKTISLQVSEEAISRVQEGFKKSANPYGRRWAKLKKRQGKPLLDTGRLRNSWHRSNLRRAGFTIAAGVQYAGYHQTGTKRMPAREMVPDAGLPREWDRSFGEIADEVLEEHFEKGSR